MTARPSNNAHCRTTRFTLLTHCIATMFRLSWPPHVQSAQVSTWYADCMADACIYLNGALIDFHPATSDYAMLTGTKSTPNGQLLKIGFSSDYACEVCRSIAHVIPDIEIGIVMDDVRYTNFDVSKYWKTQTWRFTDFTDVPEGTADKIIIFPTNEQTPLLSTLLPDELSLNISEGSLWMLMDPHANKQYTMELLCDRWNIDLNNVVAFGDDIIDIDMMQRAGTGVAVANSNPKVLNIADEICASNNDDGVAKWIDTAHS